jgi:hypothetical protein
VTDKYRRLTDLRMTQLLQDSAREDIEAARRLRNLQLALIEHLAALAVRRRR